MPLTTRVSVDGKTMRLKFTGRLDIAMAAEVLRTCRMDGATYRTYIVDLSEIDRVFDSGFALLLLLCKRARRARSDVQVISRDPDINTRCAHIGMRPMGGGTPALA